jgi:hypothetical protein
LPAVIQTITAAYGGDQAFGGSTSNKVRQVVAIASTTTSLAVSPNPSTLGQPVTFTAQVTPQISGTPIQGTVLFEDGEIGIAAVNPINGVAQFTTSTLAAGKHKMKAYFGDSADFKSSTSSVIILTVN